MVTQKRILVKPPFITWFFYEHDCDICRYVLNNVMLQLESEGWIDIRLIDVNANNGSPEVQWFNEYSERTGEVLTPTIKIIDKYWRDGRMREDPVNVFHLWDDKGDYVTEEDMEKTDRLQKHVVESINKYYRRCYNSFHDLKRKTSLMIPRRDVVLAGSI